MHREFLMGNEAIALGALAAGVNFVSGYPGTPSTEVLETVASRNPGHVHVECSVNEKAALEAAAGAAYAGARTMVTMKQVGLNVASDPLMSLEYIGVKGGMVIMVADDPGPISSQTEQDTRSFASFSKVPVFDPSSVEEAYDMIQEAFAFSEEWGTPVFFRATTRVDHGYESIEVKDPSEYEIHKAEGFVKDSSKWVIFPALSVRSHARIEERNAGLSVTLSDYRRNFILPACGAYAGDDMSSDRAGEGEECRPSNDQSNGFRPSNDQGNGFRPSNDQNNGFRPSAGTETQAGDGRLRKGIATHGISYMYTLDVLGEESHPRLLRVAVPFPFPEKLAADFLRDLDEVLCIEELDPVIERELIRVCGKYGLNVRIRGKGTGDIAPSGENTVDSVAEALAAFLGDDSLRVAAGASGAASASCASPCSLCGLPAPGFLLCGEAGHERAQDILRRRYRLLYAWKCSSSRYVRHLPLYGRRDQYRTGYLADRAGYQMLCLCRGFDILRIRDHRCSQCGLQSGRSDTDRAGQFHDGHDRAPATSRYRTDHDGPGGGKSQHRAHTGSDRAYSRGNRQPARSAGSGPNGQENSGPAGGQGNHFQVALHCARESGSGFRRTEGSVYRL